MKNTIHRVLAAVLSGACIMAGTAPVYAEGYKVQSTVKRGQTGSLTLDYKDDTDGKKPVVGAQFTLYKIGRLVMPVTGGIAKKDTVVISPGGKATVEKNGKEDPSKQTNGGVAGKDPSKNIPADEQDDDDEDTADQLDQQADDVDDDADDDTEVKDGSFSVADYLVTPVHAASVSIQKSDHRGHLPDPDGAYVWGKKSGSKKGSSSKGKNSSNGKSSSSKNKSKNGSSGKNSSSKNSKNGSKGSSSKGKNGSNGENTSSYRGRKTVNNSDDSVGVVPDSAVGNGKRAAVETYWYSLIPGINPDSRLALNPAKIEKKVREAYKSGVDGGQTYKLYTDGSGVARRSGIQQGIYLAVETKPAKEHFASMPFIVSVPHMIYSNNGKRQSWCFNLKAYPKALPGGDLKIRKRVTGNDGQKNKFWHFNINLDLRKANSTKGTTSAERYTDRFASGEAPNGYHTAKSPIKNKRYGRTYDRAKKIYKYKTSDGRTGKIGVKGTIALKSGQTATIKNIPIGTAYKVTEREANQNRYKTKVKNEEGRIKPYTAQKVSFINNRVKPVHHPRPGHPRPGRPGSGRPVRRVKTGDYAKLAIYIALIAVALSAAILIWRKSRRKEE